MVSGIKGLDRRLLTAALVLFLMFLFSCGGGGSGGSTEYAGGGVVGTGKYTGVVSSFGSIFVNGIEFSTSQATILVNGQSATEADLEVGMKVNVVAENNIATTVTYEPEIQGPVENIDTVNNKIIILGQTIFTDSATVFKGFSSLNDLQTGDNLSISGFFDASKNLRATFVEKKTSLASLELKGYVSNLDQQSKQFEIKGQTIDYSGIPSPPTLNNGDFVEIEGTLSGSTFVASEIKVEHPLISGNPGDEMEIEGIITTLSSQTEFEVNSLPVKTTSQTVFENGTIDNIALNTRVEVEGSMDASGTLVAEKVEFRFLKIKEVKLVGGVDDVSPAQSMVTVFGLTVKINNSTVMKDESLQEVSHFRLSDLQAGDYVEIGGFVNNSGEIIATKLERIDAPGAGKDLIMGPVDQNSKELTPTSARIRILNLLVDLNDPSVEFEDKDGNSIDKNTFFDSIDDTKTPGDIVEVEGTFSVSDKVFYADSAEIERIN